MKKVILAVLCAMGIMFSAQSNAAFVVDDLVFIGLIAAQGQLMVVNSEADPCFDLPLVTVKSDDGSYSYTATSREAGICK